MMADHIIKEYMHNVLCIIRRMNWSVLVGELVDDGQYSIETFQLDCPVIKSMDTTSQQDSGVGIGTILPFFMALLCFHRASGNF